MKCQAYDMGKDIYIADFETKTIAPTCVWAWGI